MTTSVLLRSICSITIFSNEVFPLPHAPYRPTVKEVGKADCNITLARLFTNDSRFSLSSEDFIMGRSGLIINTTSQYLNNLYQLTSIAFTLYKILHLYPSDFQVKSQVYKVIP